MKQVLPHACALVTYSSGKRNNTSIQRKHIAEPIIIFEQIYIAMCCTAIPRAHSFKKRQASIAQVAISPPSLQSKRSAERGRTHRTVSYARTLLGRIRLLGVKYLTHRNTTIRQKLMEPTEHMHLLKKSVTSDLQSAPTINSNLVHHIFSMQVTTLNARTLKDMHGRNTKGNNPNGT